MMGLIFRLKHAKTIAFMRLIWMPVTSRQLAKMLGLLVLHFFEAQIVAFSASSRRVARAALSLTAALALTSSIVVAQQQESVEARLKGFDSYMEQVMRDWNAPGIGIGIGIVVGDKLVS